ncbi:hypothetical protein D3C76_900030 [compost metagenome]
MPAAAHRGQGYGASLRRDELGLRAILRGAEDRLPGSGGSGAEGADQLDPDTAGTAATGAGNHGGPACDGASAECTVREAHGHRLGGSLSPGRWLRRRRCRHVSGRHRDSRGAPAGPARRAAAEGRHQESPGGGLPASAPSGRQGVAGQLHRRRHIRAPGSRRGPRQPPRGKVPAGIPSGRYPETGAGTQPE